jgi:hypothetical protein
MQKHHLAQRYLLVQYLAWFNIWRRYGRVSFILRQAPLLRDVSTLRMGRYSPTD